MKRFVTLLLFTLMVLGVQAQKQISYIKQEGTWYQVYDESGKKLASHSKSSIGEIKGWGTDFFVAKYYSFYRIYDAKGKVLKVLNVSDVGEIIGVSGKTFTSRRDSWIIIWDKEGKKISTKTAN